MVVRYVGGALVLPIRPVTRTPTGMRKGDNDHSLIRLNAKDNQVGKFSHQYRTMATIQDRKPGGIRPNEIHQSVNGLLKFFGNVWIAV